MSFGKVFAPWLIDFFILGCCQLKTIPLGASWAKNCGSKKIEMLGPLKALF